MYFENQDASRLECKKYWHSNENLKTLAHSQVKGDTTQLLSRRTHPWLYEIFIRLGMSESELCLESRTVIELNLDPIFPDAQKNTGRAVELPTRNGWSPDSVRLTTRSYLAHPIILPPKYQFFIDFSRIFDFP